MDDRMKHLLRELKEVLRIEPETEPPGFAQALDEMGPNHLTEFADELEVEGYPKPQKGHFPMWEEFGAFRERLADFMVGKDLAFAGGVAVRTYGARRGPTEDYDILAGRAHYKDLWKFLEGEGFQYVGSVESTDLMKQRDLGFELDILIADNPLYQEAMAGARSARWRGRTLKLVDPDHLAAMKVKAYAERRDDEKKAQDRRDVVSLLSKEADAERVREVLARLLPKLLPAFDEILCKP
jgi:hypothetical protein